MNLRRLSLIEAVSIGVLTLMGAIAVASLLLRGSWVVITISLLAMALVSFLMMRYAIDPDRLQARQSERILRLGWLQSRLRRSASSSYRQPWQTP